jgi:antitoxin YefM
VSASGVPLIRATILYMTVLSVADARASLSKHIESATTTHERFEITRNGARVAVLMSADDYDSLIETVDILSDPVEVAALRVAIAELDSGDVSTADDVRQAMIARHRLSE